MYKILAIAWTLLTLYLSLISARSASEFNLLWAMSLRDTNTNKNFVLFFSVSFGILMEICQFYLFNGRSFELYDILANIIGSFLGVILFKKFIN